MFTAASFKLFGVGAFQLRIVTFISGLILLFVTNKILLKAGYRKGLTILILLLFSLDPFFIKCLHEGRMDLMALLFVIAGYLQLQYWLKSPKIKYAVYIGLFLVFALLTTPRVGFLLIALTPLVFFIFSFNYKKIAILMIGIIIPLISIYSTWVFYAFGNYQNFIDFYAALTDGYTQVGGFYTYIQKNQYILIPLTLISIVFGLFSMKQKWLTPLHIFSVCSVISFYLIVKDPGPYSVFITPMFYILILSPFSTIKNGS